MERKIQILSGAFLGDVMKSLKDHKITLWVFFSFRPASIIYKANYTE